MSCFKLPDSLSKKLTSMIWNFWWGQKNDEKKIARLSWENLCEPKSYGGMGFKKLKQSNLAFLAKQGWRLQNDHNSLVYQVVKAKNFQGCDFIHATLKNNSSYTWRRTRASQSLVKEGMRWRVCNGMNIKIWEDKWLPTGPTYMIQSPRLFL